MLQNFPPKLVPAILWAILTGVSLSLRPLFPIDETRYVSVAWDMWVRHDFLVPHLNGETYSHKPPLLFWLMQLSWWLFGVNDWSPRIIAPLFSLATLYLVQAVAKELWPEQKQIAELTPFVLLGFFFWMVFSTLTMFDIMLSFFVLVGMYGILRLIRHGLSAKRWALLGIAIGGGVLTKGPVILLHILPIALLTPKWLVLQHNHVNWKQWYGGLILAILIGAAIALCWAVPAGMAGGDAYRKAIFLGQTSGRIVDSFAHKLPFWWYLQVLPLLLLPWLLMKPFWQGLAKLDLQDFGIRFCLAWSIPVFVAFSLVSGKRIHYLLPLMPALALLLAWALTQAGEVRWRRLYLWFIATLACLGLALVLLLWLNADHHWRDDLSSLSPLWGAGLIISAAIMSVMVVNKAKETVAYICVASIITALILAGGFFKVNGNRYDTAPPGQKIAELLAEKKAVAFYGSKYHGQFHFTGRLIQPLTIIVDNKDLTAFASQFPDGYVIVEYRDAKSLPEAILSFHYPFKNHNVGFILCKTLIDNPRIANTLKLS
jgi:4-amino-4-deoxy-L-arabinose transferase-like glycosyltransferase